MKRMRNAYLTCSVALALGIAGLPAAIVNTELGRRSHRTYSSPMDIARSIFDSSSKVDTAMKAIIAAVLLGAATVTLAGIWQTIRGERNGLSLAGSGVFGLIGLLAALSVVM